MNKIYNSLAVEARGGMRILFLERKIVAIILQRQDIYALAQEVLQHCMTTFVECGKLMMISTLILTWMMNVG